MPESIWDHREHLQLAIDTRDNLRDCFMVVFYERYDKTADGTPQSRYGVHPITSFLHSGRNRYVHNKWPFLMPSSGLDEMKRMLESFGHQAYVGWDNMTPAMKAIITESSILNIEFKQDPEKWLSGQNKIDNHDLCFVIGKPDIINFLSAMA